MNMPGLTAEASLYKTREFHWMSTTLEPTLGSGTVYPQRATGPFGPIGLPGQDCAGACLHVCMTFGGGFNLAHCMSECLGTCASLPGNRLRL
jgi:hypothetical protein